MDLHDFDDVAVNYDRYLDVMYKDVDNHQGFREFYLELAQEYGGEGVIDIACGTGAVLLYLAEHGIMAEGTDLSEAMCTVCREKAEKSGFNLHIFPANMTEFKAEKKYSLALIARSGFMHLTTPELQRAALCNIRENLVSGGILTLNTFQPWPVAQAEQMQCDPEKDWEYRLEYVNADGNREKIYNAITYNMDTQVMSGNWKFETLDDEGNVIAERIRPLAMRQTYEQEMRYLAELCGFEVVNRYYGYYRATDRSDPKAGRDLIWILKKKDC